VNAWLVQLVHLLQQAQIISVTVDALRPLTKTTVTVLFAQMGQAPQPDPPTLATADAKSTTIKLMESVMPALRILTPLKVPRISLTVDAFPVCTKRTTNATFVLKGQALLLGQHTLLTVDAALAATKKTVNVLLVQKGLLLQLVLPTSNIAGVVLAATKKTANVFRVRKERLLLLVPLTQVTVNVQQATLLTLHSTSVSFVR